MTTDDEAALLKAVIENPDDDAPRLAYADWCDRRGDPRGRFIRVQVELAKVEWDLKNPQRQPLEEESMTLLEAHGNEWMIRRHPAVIECQMHRGFVAGVTMTAASFLEHFATLSAQHPIQLLILRNLVGHAQEVLTSPSLKRISSLSANRGNITDEDIKTFARSPYVGNIWWLGLSRNLITRDGVEALITSPLLNKLGFVGLDGNPCDPVETAGFDQGCLVDKQMPVDGRELEARFGPIKWLHYRENASPFQPVAER